MKKTIFFSILSLILLSSFPVGAVKKVEANPINVAVMLMQEKDTAAMASTLRYYGYECQTPSMGSTGAYFTHPNGSTIRFKCSDSNQQFPTVEVTSKGSTKEKDKILQNLNFNKEGDGYEQKSVGYKTRCKSGSHGTLIFTRHAKVRE